LSHARVSNAFSMRCFGAAAKAADGPATRTALV
jgi:hypothetical protein